MPGRAQEVAERLGGLKAVPTGSGWLVPCPAHDDTDPSLHVSPRGNDDGQPVFHCFAGCGWERLHPVLRAMGVLDAAKGGRKGGKGNGAARPRDEDAPEWAGPQEPQGAPILHTRKLGAPTHVWTYHTPEGEVNEYVARYAVDGPKKQIRPWSWWHDKPGRSPRLQMKAPPPGRRWPYRTLEIDRRAGAVVVCCEGEKTADAADRLMPDVVATCWPGAGSGASGTRWEKLAGHVVVLIPDEDAAGRRAMAAAWRAMERAGVTAHWVELESVCPALGDGDRKGRDWADAEHDGWTRQRCDTRRRALPRGHPLHLEGGSMR